jgi:hypothetical protein
LDIGNWILGYWGMGYEICDIGYVIFGYWYIVHTRHAEFISASFPANFMLGHY